MSGQTKAWQLSLVIHALVIVGCMGLSRSVVRFNQPLEINFEVRSSTFDRPEPQQRSVPVERRPDKVVRPVEKTVQPIGQERERAVEQPPSPPVSEGQVSAPSPEGIMARKGEGVGPVEPAKGPLAPSSAGRSEPGTASAGNVHTDPAGAVNEKAKYLKDHFVYIRDLVQKCVSYPRMAKKMGWEGKVVVAFTILADGSARDVKVIQGCGIDLLNTSAVEAVKKACPFPKPPVEAQIVLPVVYRLT
ncbi:MAG: energy transducer TonB [Deltaproteobacteria bacterium]|nr:energy transducer TonB [Deltaproteobacteria bacterium]